MGILSKNRRPSPAIPQQDSGHAAPSSPSGARRQGAAPTRAVETFGRSCAPPPQGSDYWEFLHWASEGCTPFQEDTDLAISLWMGLSPAADEPSTPGAR